ncbi:hypothetical protein [Bacillus benzoevorans]|uniref:Uncharacterized protein n=1 Tax=Bacillus benzoevorans TaxID=1456 RepID=A0A7X0LU38_9BACI|nr:hypothetical protein [Bacillus benzoevorans]MBB6444055.1 hypothetical protein [Bacillus benzoevorans]
MNIIFGTIEFFEKEILSYLNENRTKERMEEPLTIITSQLEHELLYDFICDETIRMQCRRNLEDAIQNVSQKMEAVSG